MFDVPTKSALFTIVGVVALMNHSQEKVSLNEDVSLNRLIKLLRSRLAGALFADSWLYWVNIAIFVGGSVLIVCHAIGIESRELELAIFASCLILPVVIALINIRGKIPQRNMLLTLLASRSESPESGLIAAADEINLSDWNDKISLPDLPLIRVDYQRRLIIFMLGAAFLLGSLAFPKIIPEINHKYSLNINADRSELEQRIKVLKQEDIFSEVKAEELQRQLEKIAEDADGNDPEKTWEALDHLAQKLDDKIMATEEETVATMQKLALLEKATETMAGATDVDSENYAMAMKGLEQMMKELAELDPKLKTLLSKNGKLDQAALEQLMKKYGLTREQLQKLLKKLSQCKSGNFKNCKNARYATLEELKNFIESNCSNPEAECLLLYLCNNAGGVNRGPGDAPMTWRKRELKFPHSFKDQQLPDSQLLDFKNSIVTGRSRGAPEKSPEGKSATSNLNKAKIKSQNSAGFVIQPRHRKSVKQYFKFAGDKKR